MKIKRTAFTGLALATLAQGQSTRRNTVVPMQSASLKTPTDYPVFETSHFNLHDQPQFMAHITGQNMDCLVVPDMGTPLLDCSKGSAKGAITLGDLDVNGNQHFNLAVNEKSGESLSVNMIMKPEGIVNPHSSNFNVMKKNDDKGYGYDINYTPPSKTEPQASFTTSVTPPVPTGTTTPADTAPNTEKGDKPQGNPEQGLAPSNKLNNWLAGGAVAFAMFKAVA